MNAHQQYEHWNPPALPHPDSSGGSGQTAQENPNHRQLQHSYHYAFQTPVTAQPQHFMHAPLPALADPFAQSWQPTPEVVQQYDPGNGPAYAAYGMLQAPGLGHRIPQPATMFRPEPMVAIGNAVEPSGDTYASYTVIAQFQLQMRLPPSNIGQTAYPGSGRESDRVHNPMLHHAHSQHVAPNPALFTNSPLNPGPSSAVTNDRVSLPIASGPPSTQDQMLEHGQQIVHPDRGNALPPMFYSESWSSMPRTAQMAQMVSPPGFGTTVERSTAPVGLDVQRNNNYTPPANSQADNNGGSRAAKIRGSSSGGPVRSERGRAAVAPYSTTRRKTVTIRGDATTAVATEDPAKPSQPPVGQDWNAPWQSGTATKYTAAAAKSYLKTLPKTEWHDSAGFFCPFKGCRKHQSGARYDTYTSLVGHVRRCGPDRECELCKEMIARGYQPYEMQRHRRGGNKDGKDPTQPWKKKDNRTPCTVTEACGGDDKHEAIYAHLKSKGELGLVDSLQFGDDTDTYSDYLGPRMRRYRSALGEGPSTRRTATTEVERTQSPVTEEAEEHAE